MEMGDNQKVITQISQRQQQILRKPRNAREYLFGFPVPLFFIRFDERNKQMPYFSEIGMADGDGTVHPFGFS